MEIGTYKELIAFASTKFEPQIACELEKFLAFTSSHSFEEVLNCEFALDIRPSTITTKAAGEVNFEAHKKMWDLQLIFSGKEAISVLPVEKAGSLTKDYDESSDIEFFATAEDPCGCLFTLERGNGIFLAPCDAHAPCLIAGEADTHHKIVVKIPVSCEI